LSQDSEELVANEYARILASAVYLDLDEYLTLLGRGQSGIAELRKKFVQAREVSA